MKKAAYGDGLDRIENWLLLDRPLDRVGAELGKLVAEGQEVLEGC